MKIIADFSIGYQAMLLYSYRNDPIEQYFTMNSPDPGPDPAPIGFNLEQGQDQGQGQEMCQVDYLFIKTRC